MGHRIGPAFSPWSELLRVRSTLEQGPGIPTEPDVMLRIPGQAIALIEAKFGSPNGMFKGKKGRFGSIDDFLERYKAKPGEAHPLNKEWIRQQPSQLILEQLCRNVLFAQLLGAEREQSFVVNLVRREAKTGEAHFRSHLSGQPIGVSRRTWVEIYSCGEILS